MLNSMHVTMSISTGLYPKLDLWKASKLHYITNYVRLVCCPEPANHGSDGQPRKICARSYYQPTPPNIPLERVAGLQCGAAVARSLAQLSFRTQHVSMIDPWQMDPNAAND